MRPVVEHAVLHLRGTQAKDGLQRLCINRCSVQTSFLLLKNNYLNVLMMKK
jgi:hypothetical protein